MPIKQVVPIVAQHYKKNFTCMLHGMEIKEFKTMQKP